MTSRLKLIFAVFLVSVFVTGNVAFAAGPTETLTTLGNSAFEGAKLSFLDLDIENTAINWLISMAVSAPTHVIFNASFDQTMCIIVQRYGQPCDAEITKQVALYQGDRHAGSVFGLASILNKNLIEDPIIPVNLAYYAKHQASKIPILSNTAFAQSATTQEDMLLGSILAVWEQVRNLAYGFLAIFMLVTGVLIMMKKKINPQTVVTVQYAIPRVIIAAILIAFSYPIGALIFQSAGFFINVAGSLAANAFVNVTGPTIDSGTVLMAVGILPLLLFIGAASTGGSLLIGGAFALIAWIILALTILVAYISALFKLMGSYFNILASIIVGPIVFAWGAIPGNEVSVTDWFKKQLVNIGSIAGITFGIGITVGIAQSITASVFSQLSGVTLGANLESWSLIAQTGLYATFGLPLLIVVLLLQIGKIPKQLDEAVLGKKK